MTSVIASQGDTIDLICHRYYGRTAGVTESVLAANPGIADLGPVLPLGTRVQLPPQPETGTTIRTLINLWD